MIARGEWLCYNDSLPYRRSRPYSFGWSLVAPPGLEGFKVFTMGDAQEASCVQAPPGVPAHWVAHVFVGPLKPSVQKAIALGAKVCVDEIEVPGMGAFSVIEDPTGAIICLFGQP